MSGCRLCHVRHVVRDGDRGHVLALLRLPEALVADGARGGAGRERGGPGALDARVHVRLVVVTDEEEAVPALERPGERLQPDVIGAAVAGEDHNRDLLLRRKGVPAAQRPLRGLHAARDRSGVLEGDMDPRDGPGRGRVARRRHLEAPGRIDDDDRLLDGAQDGAHHDRDAAALAERVTAAQRLHPVLVADECLQTRHGSPLRPTYGGASPSKRPAMSAGCRSRPPSP